MRATAVWLMLAASASADVGAAPARVRIRPFAFKRGLPHTFFDESVESLKAVHPKVRFIERLRFGQMGALSYALVASMPGRRAPRAEVMAMAVNGLRAWYLSLSFDPSEYPAARKALMAELQGLSGPYVPPAAEMAVRDRGQAVPVPADDTADLVWDVEVLIATCSVQLAARPTPDRPQLELSLRYAAPRDLGLDLPDGQPLGIERIAIVADPARGDPWPTQQVRYRGGEIGLGKCDGMGALRLLCRPEIRPHASEAVTRNCAIVPR